MKRLGNVIFYVRDVEATVCFFEQAFGLTRDFIDPTGQYAQMQTGSTALGFASLALAEKNLLQTFRPFRKDELPGCEISILCDDVAGSFAKALATGAELICSPQEKPWGQTVGYVRDPKNGILIEIASEMSLCPES